MWHELGVSLKSFLPDTSMIFWYAFKGSDTGVLYRFFHQSFNKHVCLLCTVYKSALSLVLSGLISLCVNVFLYWLKGETFLHWPILEFLVQQMPSCLLCGDRAGWKLLFFQQNSLECDFFCIEHLFGILVLHPVWLRVHAAQPVQAEIVGDED